MIPSALGKFSESVDLIQVLVKLEFPAPYADLSDAMMRAAQLIDR